MSRVLYNEWVDSFADVIYRFALKNTRDSEQAKDLVQDAFEKLWIKKDQIDASKAKAYLFQIVSNALIDRARRAKLNATFREQLSSNDSLVKLGPFIFEWNKKNKNSNFLSMLPSNQ